MDPLLRELVESGPEDEEVSVILRLEKGAEPPASVQIVSRFGEIATARIRRSDIPAAWESDQVASMKAPQVVVPPPPPPSGMTDQDEFDEAEDTGFDDAANATAAASLAGVPEDGRGVVVGVCDWGIDFTHPNFRLDDGRTRIEALWDQRGSGDTLAPAPYKRGRLLTRDAINQALLQSDPCRALGYHPASADANDSGTHGTHVVDIIAGNRRAPGSVVGLASGSDLVFVHLGAQRVGELGNLGDSAGLLEGLDFLRRQAAGRPCVMHLSAGKTGGPHRGTTLLERAVDAMLLETPGLVLVQSVGNYADAAMHTHARVGPDQQHTLRWTIPDDDRTPNELEIWYSGQDVFEVQLIAPNGRTFSVPLDGRERITNGSRVWGNFYHRLHEPNSGLNHIVIFLYATAPAGQWRVVLRGHDVVDGRLHAWIERDAGSRFQSRFTRSQATSLYTTNTICNCYRAIAVGAYDATQSDRPPTVFSSRGPTADGRQKPEIAAPGFRIRAARSLPRGGWAPGQSRLCVKSGTSMAAPWVSGTVALMFQAAGRPLTIHEVRRILIGTSDPHSGPSGRSSTQLGYGYLNTAAAVNAARRLGAEQPAPADGSAARQAVEDVGAAASVDVEMMAPELSESEVAAESALAPGETVLTLSEAAPRSAIEWTERDCGCSGGAYQTSPASQLDYSQSYPSVLNPEFVPGELREVLERDESDR
jgi:subtilisin family serine protease